VIQLPHHRWRPSRRQLLWGSAALAAITLPILSVLIGYRYGITLWDWIQLLIVPAAIAGVGLWFNRQQRARELESTEQRAQDEALQTYLDHMGQLLLDKDTPLRQSKEDDDVRTLARAWTLTVLPRLDGFRKRSVVQFLYESGLITKGHVVIDLTGAHLAAVNLTSVNLKGANLHGAYMARANLTDARLSEADLGDAKLFGANLSLAKLDGANLSAAVLMGDERGTPLQRISVIRTYTLGDAGPKDANLRHADLSGANLLDAYVSEEQLDSAESLKGATMPNGRKYEDWLKRGKGRREDGENGGPSQRLRTNSVEGRLAELRRIGLLRSSVGEQAPTHQDLSVPSAI
jgi:hypothetical protein